MLIAPEEPGADTVSASVLKVFDGDGFLARIWNPLRNSHHDVAFRFGFTDAPEMEQPGGKEAKAFLTSLIGDRRVDLAILTKMDTGGVTDRHGRVVCVPYLRPEFSLVAAIASLATGRASHEGVARNVELEMVLNGWAWVLDRYGPDERYFDALEDAQRHRRGIWAFDNNVHPWDFKQRKYRTRQPSRTPASQPSLASKDRAHAACPLPGCGGRLVNRNGKFGPFLGCSNYPTCRYSCAPGLTEP